MFSLLVVSQERRVHSWLIGQGHQVIPIVGGYAIEMERMSDAEMLRDDILTRFPQTKVLMEISRSW